MGIEIIHLVTNGIGETSGGPTWVVINLAKEFARGGQKVKISSFGNSKKDQLDLELLRDDLFAAGITLDFYFSNILNKYGFGNWKAVIKVLHQSSEADPLIFNYVYSFPLFIQSIFSRRNNGLFLIPHGSYSREEFRKFNFVKYVFRFVLFLSRFHRKFHIVFATKLERSNSVFRVSQNQSVIGFGIEPESNFHNKPDLTNKLLFLGRIDRVKNLGGLLYALKLLDLKKLSISLEIAGDGDMTEVLLLKNIVAKQNLEDFVTFTGWRSGSQKQESLMSSKVLILPSHSENFGVVVLEAAVKGIPSVLTPNVGIAEKVAMAKAGAVAESTSPADISSAISEVLNDWNTFSNNALRFSKDNSWREIGREWNLLFKTQS